MRLSEDITITGNRAMARSYAKINLTLDVLGKREDGYHNLQTVMQTVGLSDLVIVDKTNYGIRLTTNKKFLPNNSKNIAYQAAAKFFEKTKIKGGAKILIHKNIPIAAGLAGGSGNGAAVLSALNMLYSNPLTEGELCALGATIGADVPYCIMGGTQLAEGIGEVLTPQKPLSRHLVLLVTPPIAVSTPQVFGEFDSIKKEIFPDNAAMLKAINDEDFYGVCKNLANSLESVTIRQHPVIGEIKEKMLSGGAVNAIMSGSGPTVFGLFDDFNKAKQAHDAFCEKYKDVFLTTTV